MAKRASGRRVLAKNMRRMRHLRGWSQEDLAEEAGLHRTYIGAVEREERNVSIDNIERIAVALETSLSDMLDDR